MRNLIDVTEQWHHNDGSRGVIGSGINSYKAWETTRGCNSIRPVRIAVIDIGMQVDHPALKDGIIGGGYFDSATQGSHFNFIPYREGMSGFPDDNHGTFCLGMAGARNTVFGAAPESHLMVIACNPASIIHTLARAICYAADPRFEDAHAYSEDGADIIACSLGPPENESRRFSSILNGALAFAATQGRNGLGIPIFWAVNNNYRPIAEDSICSNEYVVAVGKSNCFNQADGSAFGSKLDFLAPGANVYSTRSNNQYGSGSGTSYAAALAAGVAALVLARYPDWSRYQVLDRLRSSCDRIGGVRYKAGRHADYGYGRINAAKAVG
jgi:subtilisin family serine protease